MLTDKELDAIRRKLLELEDEPPVSGWAKIQTDLQPPKPWRLRWLWVAALLFVGIGGGILYQLLNAPDAAMPHADINNGATIHAPASEAVAAEKEKHPSITTTGQAPLLPSVAHQAQQDAVQAAQTLEVEKERNLVTAASRQVQPHVPTPAGQEGAAVVSAVEKERAIAEVATASPIEHRAPASAQLGSLSLPLPEAAPDATGLLSADGAGGGAGTPEQIVHERTEALLPQLVRTRAVMPLKEGALKLKPFKTVAEVEGSPLDEPPVVDPQSRKKEWSVGVYVAPRYAYRSFRPSGTDEVMITGLNQQQHSPRDRFGYEWGTQFSSALSNRLQLDAGLSFLKLQENISYSYTTGRVESTERVKISENELQLTPVYAMEERQLVSAFAYGSLHAGATYHFLQNAYRRFSFTAGGAVNLLLKGQTTEYINGEWVRTTGFPAEDNILEQSNYSFYIGAGYNRSISKQYELSAMPMLNYFLGSTFNEREPFGLRPYSLGLKLQLQRRFNVKTAAVY